MRDCLTLKGESLLKDERKGRCLCSNNNIMLYVETFSPYFVMLSGTRFDIKRKIPDLQLSPTTAQ